MSTLSLPRLIATDTLSWQVGYHRFLRRFHMCPDFFSEHICKYKGEDMIGDFGRLCFTVTSAGIYLQSISGDKGTSFIADWEAIKFFAGNKPGELTHWTPPYFQVWFFCWFKFGKGTKLCLGRVQNKALSYSIDPWHFCWRQDKFLLTKRSQLIIIMVNMADVIFVTSITSSASVKLFILG